MPDISQITLPSGTTYDIKDAVARQAIGGYTKFLGVTTTALTDGSTTNPITINGASVTAVAGDITTYSNAEFIFNGAAWQAFGDLSALGDLAYKDTASGSGTVAVPKTFTTTVTPAAKNVSVSGTTVGSVSVTKSNVTVSKASSGTATYTPEGSVSVTPSKSTKYVASSSTGGGSVTAGTAASCTLPSMTATVSGETLTLGWTAGSFTANTPTAVTLPSFSSLGIATGISSASFTGTGARLITDSEVATDASFTGASMTSTGSYTPATPTASTTVATTENKTVSVTVS